MVGAVPPDGAGVRPEHAERNSHGRRLAGPVGAEEAHDVTARRLQLEAVERDDAPEPLDQAPDNERHPAGG
jgi:hypothetical protein